MPGRGTQASRPVLQPPPIPFQYRGGHGTQVSWELCNGVKLSWALPGYSVFIFTLKAAPPVPPHAPLDSCHGD